MEESIFLVEPNAGMKEQFIDMVLQYKRSGEEHYFNKYKGALESFDGYLKKLENDAKGIGIQGNSVPAISYWLTDSEKRFLGVIRLRVSMDNEYVRRFTGNIGYDIAPAQRGKGYGANILRLGLEKAKALKLDRVLITCDDDNHGSMRVIEKNGGVFESEVFNEEKKKQIRRYWIQL